MLPILINTLLSGLDVATLGEPQNNLVSVDVATLAEPHNNLVSLPKCNKTNKRLWIEVWILLDMTLKVKGHCKGGSSVQFAHLTSTDLRGQMFLNYELMSHTNFVEIGSPFEKIYSFYVKGALGCCNKSICKSSFSLKNLPKTFLSQ